MARPLRIDFPGAFHHVTNRGARRQDIFYCPQDRLEFLRLIKITVSQKARGTPLVRLLSHMRTRPKSLACRSRKREVIQQLGTCNLLRP